MKNTKSLKTDITNKYIKYIKEHSLDIELYKWRRCKEYEGELVPDMETIHQQIYSYDYSTLVYPVSVTTMRNLSKAKPKQYAKYIGDLLDVNTPLEKRVENFIENISVLYKEYDPKHGSQHDERTVATILAYYDASTYPFYKSSFYGKYCKYIGVKKAKSKKRYIHYIKLLDEFVSEVVVDNDELLKLIKPYFNDSCHPDPNYYILGQDILRTVFDVAEQYDFTVWKVGCRGENKHDYSSDMINNSSANVGWNELGDLNSFVTKKEDINQRLSMLKPEYAKNVASRKASEIFSIYKRAKVGDYIMLTYGHTVKAIGTVSSEYRYNPEMVFHHERGVDWKYPSISNCQITELPNTTFVRLQKPDSMALLQKVIEGNNSETPTAKKQNGPLNQILYGPPGTGKTYETATIALDILGVKYDKSDRVATMENYRKEVATGNVDFTTFHQSMAYEDFIEGIKPVMVEGSENAEGPSQSDIKDVGYTVSPGVLMKMAALAAYENYVRHQSASTPINFDYLYDQYIDSLREKIEEGKPKVIYTYQGLPLLIDRINRNDSIITLYQGSSRSSRSRPKRRDHLRVLYAKVKNIGEIKNVKDIGPLIGTRGGMSGYWAVLKDFIEFAKGVDQSVIDTDEVSPDLSDIIKDFKNGLYNDVPFDNDSPKKVLIIDEINRGNVSAIFGELITLLEKDKRIGEVNQITASLPYTENAKFSLPPNLYIIGTMNTADRSVEALDSALRRRFTFKEKMPEPSVLMEQDIEKYKTEFFGYGLENILTVINQRIEVLIDRDHMIGHSYFMNLQKEEDIIPVFTDKVIPLLQEYFYNDYSKIEMVLGSGFVKAEKSKTVRFAKTKYDTDIDTPETSYELVPITAENIKPALAALLNAEAS